MIGYLFINIFFRHRVGLPLASVTLSYQACIWFWMKCTLNFSSVRAAIVGNKSSETKILSFFSSIFGRKKDDLKSTDTRKVDARPEDAKQHPPRDQSRQKKRKGWSKNGLPATSDLKKQPPKVPEWDIAQFQVEPEEGKRRFHDFDLPVGLMRAIAESGFKYCTPIQAEVLGSTLAGQDAIGKAQTGTGKTAAFLISTIKQLFAIAPPATRYVGEPRAVVIAPTRELALQIGQDAEQLTRHLPLNVVTIVGGMDYEKQRKRLSADYVDILVATPGRLLDFCQRGDLYLDLLETLVIDEADRMLDMGFIPQVRRIVRMTPRAGDRQTLLFSATFTDDVLRLGEQWTWHPVKVEIEPDSVVTDTVDQKIYIVTSEQKFPLLVNLINKATVGTRHCLH